MVSRLPVRTSVPFPKNDVPALLEAIYALRVALPVARGDVLIKDYKGSGVDVIATRTLGS
jgi:CxxC motif-containing protein